MDVEPIPSIPSLDSKTSLHSSVFSDRAAITNQNPERHGWRAATNDAAGAACKEEHLQERRLREVHHRFSHDGLEPAAIYVCGAEPVARKPGEPRVAVRWPAVLMLLLLLVVMRSPGRDLLQAG
jgi:hypothetical protein